MIRNDLFFIQFLLRDASIQMMYSSLPSIDMCLFLLNIPVALDHPHILSTNPLERLYQPFFFDTYSGEASVKPDALRTSNVEASEISDLLEVIFMSF